MIKKTNAILISLLALCGCTREVYLQEVPCADCEPQVVEPCPELQTELVVYQVYEAPMTCPQTCPCSYQMTCQTCCQQQSTTYTYTYTY